MNVKGLLADAQEVFVKNLPEIAELVKTEYQVENYTGHQAVADLLHHHQDDLLPVLRFQADDFKTMYCKIHGMEQFPSYTPHTTPTTPTQLPQTSTTVNSNAITSGRQTAVMSSGWGWRRGPPGALDTS